MEIKATPISPNPCDFDESITILKVETIGSEESGHKLCDTPAAKMDMTTRNFKLTKRLF